MVTISLKFPESLNSRLTAEARRRGTSKSALIRDAVEKSLENGGTSGNRDKDPRRAALARLSGCLRGPGDLSFNEEHMKGFGQ